MLLPCPYRTQTQCAVFSSAQHCMARAHPAPSSHPQQTPPWSRHPHSGLGRVKEDLVMYLLCLPLSPHTPEPTQHPVGRLPVLGAWQKAPGGFTAAEA